MIRIYTDGCCLNNQEKENKGGWSFIAVSPDNQIIKISTNKEINTTNQRMELTACIQAMLFGISIDEKDIEILTDSAYVVNCVKDGWYLKWIRNDWKNSQKEPVKNQELWETFIKLLEAKYFKFTYIKAHNGDMYNEQADQLAKIAAKAAPSD